MSNYINLHTHTHYSLLDGLNTPEEYCARAKELGMEHLAITDHGTLSGHRDFQRAAKANGITPILGMEGYISATDRFDKRTKAARQDGTSIYNHITLLAQNEVGIKTLQGLSKIAWNEGYYFKPRMDSELLFDNNDGIIVLSGCMSGLVAKNILNGYQKNAESIAQTYQQVLGDRFFIEVMSSNDEELNHALLALADKFSIPPIMTTDCHYARQEDLAIEEAMLIISTKPKRDFSYDYAKTKGKSILERFNLLYPNRSMTFEQIEIYLRDYQTEVAKFRAQGITRTDIYENTLHVGSTIGEYPYYEGLDLLPRPNTGDPATILRQKAEAGLAKRRLNNKPEYVARLDEELEIIKSKDFDTYFLIVEDAVTWARNKGIRVGPGRGSGAGSLVNYALGITDADPIKYNLLFFRFVDPSRSDFPDIDVDFQDNRRSEIKEYIAKKYGHVASIATFNRFQGKSSLKSAASVFGVPSADINRATKNNDAPLNSYYFDTFDNTDKGREFTEKYPEVVDMAKKLYGRNRSGGMHASGLVVANQDISNFISMETQKDPNDKNSPRVAMVAADMNECADIGMIKLDILGLKAMTIIDDTIKLINERHQKNIVLSNINLEDKKVYEVISSGYTRGVFQCEAAPYTNLIVRMGGVWSFDELAASNALVRPGAMNTIGAEYIARKNGHKQTTYIHPDTEWFTNDTYGEVLYQEQVMLMMTEIAGMDMSTANKVRKIIGKKKDVSEFEAYKAEFIEGASNKITKSQAEKLWIDFEAHAGYSFNKSHAVAYSMISVYTAWLKVNYPLEFMTATLRNESDKDSITDYLIECKRLGLPVRLPHVNESDFEISIEKNGIRLGLTNLKYVGDSVARKIIEHRPFESYQALLQKVDEKGSGLSTRTLSALNAVGAATFPDNPKRGDERDNFYEYLGIPAFATQSIDPYIQNKFIDFDEYEEKGCFAVMGMIRKIKRGPGWSRVEAVDETGVAAMFSTEDTPIEEGQMYAMLVADNSIAKYLTMDELVSGVQTSFSKFLRQNTLTIPEDNYRVIAFTSRTTRAGKKMATAVLQDHLGTLHAVLVFPQMYVKAYSKLKEGAIVNVVVAETQEDSTKFLKEVL